MSGKGITKITSESLVQGLVALVIITTIFTIGVMIFLNVMASNNSYQKISSNLIMEEIAVQTKKNKTYFNEELEVENFKIIKVVEKFQGDLYLLELKMLDSRQKVVEQRRELILLNQ